MIRKYVVVCAVAGLVALSACGSDSGSDDQSSGDTATESTADGSDQATDGELTQLTVALPVNLCMANWPFYVADQQGLFADEGLEVALQGLDGSSAAIQATLAGQAQMAVTAPADLLAASGAGADVTAWYSIYRFLPFNIVTLSDSGITGLTDLEGKTIGISSPSGGDAIFMRSLLSLAGVEPGTYTELPVGEGEAAATAVSDGTVDAYSASFVEQLVFGGMGIDFTVLDADEYPDVAGLLIMTETEWYDANTDAVVGVGRALAQATDAGLADRQLVIDTCTAVAPDETSDLGFATVVLDAVDGFYALPAGSDAQHGAVDEGAWSDYRSLLVDLEIVDAPALETPLSNEHVAAWNGN